MPKLRIKDPSDSTWKIPDNGYHKSGGSWQPVSRVWRKEAGNWIQHWPNGIPVSWDTSGTTVQTTGITTVQRPQNTGFSGYVDVLIPAAERSLYAAHVVGLRGNVQMYYSDDGDDSTWGGYIRIGLGLTYSRQLVDPSREPGVMSIGTPSLRGPASTGFTTDSGYLTVEAPTTVGSPAGSPAQTFQDEVIVGARFRVAMNKPGGDDDNLTNYSYAYTVYLYTAPVLVSGTPWKLDVSGEPISTVNANASNACVGHDSGSATPYVTTTAQLNAPFNTIATSFAPRWRRTCSGCDDDDIGCVRQYIYLRGTYKNALLVS